MFRGYLSDFDCRWYAESASCDDRTSEERGEKVANYAQCIPTSLVPMRHFIPFPHKYLGRRLTYQPGEAELLDNI